MRRLPILLSALALLWGASPALAQVGEPTFSVDFQGPTVSIPLPDFFFGVPITEGDILTQGLPGLVCGANPPLLGPLPTPGIEVGGLAGPIGAVPGGLGIFPGLAGGPELDALSYGRDKGCVLYFSVDEFAFGVPSPLPPNVFSEGAVGALEASADVFRFLGLALFPTPPGPPIGNTSFTDGDGLFPSGLPGVGLIEPNPPTLGLLPDPGDNLDAVNIDTTCADVSGLIFFSLDASFPDFLEVFPANTATAFANGFSGADVLVSSAGAGPVLAIPAFDLGLDLAGFGTDDLDALAYDDADGSVTLTPGDTIYYSVRRGSAVIGTPDSFFGVPIEEGDVLTTAGPGVPPGIFLAAEVMGLGTIRAGTAGPFGADDVDALDILRPLKVPAFGAVGHAALVALLLGGGLVARMRRAARA